MSGRADDLYGLPPGEFTAARDALAKELKAGGDKDAAAAVKRLRKPSAAAWALNRAARERGRELETFLEAGAELRDAHAALLVGKADRAVLKEAVDGERAATAEFLQIVRKVAGEAGEQLSEPVLAKVRETLHAATLDDDVRASLEAGRLEREADAVGGGGFGSGGDAPGPRATKARGKTPEPEPPGPTAAERREAAAGPSAAQRREAAAAAETALKALKEADRDARRAEREAETSRRKLERAERQVDKARADLESAEDDFAAAQDEASDAQRDVREAKGALAAAQEAADAARAAL